MIDEGYIKYQCYWSSEEAIAESDITALNSWRDRLYQLGLIGVYDNGIGFGNLSRRLLDSEQLIISGTQTGGLSRLGAEHYTKVTDYSWQDNYVTCQGLIKASSETLTHAAIYSALPQVNAVIHVHHQTLWTHLLHRLPTTDPNCAYGTPEMATEIMRLCQQPSTQERQIIAMSGHESGILSFGVDLDQAGEVLLKHFATIKPNKLTY
ncbi:MAG: class II aldolase/adducin family protein [Cyanobacteria bacterium J06623_7]